MSYVAVRLDADADAADDWGDVLLAAGALSVDVADPHAGTVDETPLFGEPGEETGRRWPTSRLVALFPAVADVAAALAAAAEAMSRPLPPHEFTEVPDQDWVRATQAQFGPIRIADRLWIVPSWCTPPDPAAENLVLDPGLAFGTGSHPTTRLCLRWLTEALHGGESVLDYGCGSGILAIAAARLGAGRVVGTDIDPQAMDAATANAAANGVDARFLLPDALATADLPPFDVVVANILANPLRLLAPALAQRTAPGGRVVLSGVLAAQADEVAATYADWFNIGTWADDEGWVALAGTRRSGPVR
jgi:ribosomal protein L11 methyltransferase